MRGLSCFTGSTERAAGRSAPAQEALLRNALPRTKALPTGPSRQRALDIANAVRKENGGGF